MSREKAGYRDTIADLNRVFPVQGTLSKKDVALYMGVSVKTVTRKGIQFDPVLGRVTKADLARQICL